MVSADDESAEDDEWFGDVVPELCGSCGRGARDGVGCSDVSNSD